MRYWVVRLASIALALFACYGIDVMSLGWNSYNQRIFALVGLYVTLAVSLNLINGITGQFSIGHAAFYQVGAYLSGYLSVTYYDKMGLHGLPWLFVMMFAGAAGAAVAGFVVGLPSLRLRGDYLAIVTMGFGEIIRIIVENTDKIGGSYGMNVQPKFLHVGVIWLLAIVCIAVCRNLLKTAHGLPFLAVREDEIASSAMGVNVTSTKVTAFVLGSAFAGAAGALLAHYEGFITPTTFAMDTSFIILTMVVMGGTGSITGSAISAALLAYLPEYLRKLQNADGTPLAVTGASVLAALLTVAIVVGVVRTIINMPGASSQKRTLYIVGCLVAAGLIKVVLQAGLILVPYLSNLHIEAGQLRMVIFAVSLVVIMLLRPQGIFAHHEFSWSWVKKVLGKKDSPSTAVAS